MNLLIRSATIRATPVWVCSNCGIDARGSTVSIDLGNLSCSADDLARAIGRHQASRQTIPVGWASHGTAGVTCPDCHQ